MLPRKVAPRALHPLALNPLRPCVDPVQCIASAAHACGLCRWALLLARCPRQPAPGSSGGGQTQEPGLTGWPWTPEQQSMLAPSLHDAWLLSEQCGLVRRAVQRLTPAMSLRTLAAPWLLLHGSHSVRTSCMLGSDGAWSPTLHWPLIPVPDAAVAEAGGAQRGPVQGQPTHTLPLWQGQRASGHVDHSLLVPCYSCQAQSGWLRQPKHSEPQCIAAVAAQADVGGHESEEQVQGQPWQLSAMTGPVQQGCLPRVLRAPPPGVLLPPGGTRRGRGQHVQMCLEQRERGAGNMCQSCCQHLPVM
jgi:hypothetical protein